MVLANIRCGNLKTITKNDIIKFCKNMILYLKDRLSLFKKHKSHIKSSTLISETKEDIDKYEKKLKELEE